MRRRFLLPALAPLVSLTFFTPLISAQDRIDFLKKRIAEEQKKIDYWKPFLQKYGKPPSQKSPKGSHMILVPLQKQYSNKEYVRQSKYDHYVEDPFTGIYYVPMTIDSYRDYFNRRWGRLSQRHQDYLWKRRLRDSAEMLEWVQFYIWDTEDTIRLSQEEIARLTGTPQQPPTPPPSKAPPPSKSQRVTPNQINAGKGLVNTAYQEWLRARKESLKDRGLDTPANIENAERELKRIANNLSGPIQEEFAKHGQSGWNLWKKLVERITEIATSEKGRLGGDHFHFPRSVAIGKFRKEKEKIPVVR